MCNIQLQETTLCEAISTVARSCFFWSVIWKEKKLSRGWKTQCSEKEPLCCRLPHGFYQWRFWSTIVTRGIQILTILLFTIAERNFGDEPRPPVASQRVNIWTTTASFPSPFFRFPFLSTICHYILSIFSSLSISVNIDCIHWEKKFGIFCYNCIVKQL